jgi:hypothetical protein
MRQLATIGLVLCLVGGGAWGAPPRPPPRFAWKKWQPGFELGGTALGHFGLSSAGAAPPGAFYLVPNAHYWYQHLFEAHLDLGFAISGGGMFYGLGTRLNLLELINDSSRLVSSQSSQRGVAAPLIRDLMLFFSLDFRHFSFKEPDPGYFYETSVWSLMPGVGMQWYFPCPIQNGVRCYLETSLAYGTTSGAKLLFPHVGLGLELK